MSISADGKALSGVTRQLAVQWQETARQWQDARSREFEQKYLQELIADVDRAASVFDELEKFVSRVRSDCE
jgi:hypothetical protein